MIPCPVSMGPPFMVYPPATSSSFSFLGPCGPRPNGKPGAFCCKSGKYVTRHKHIKIKITGIPCLQKNSTVILSEEGFNRNSNRIDSLYQELEEKYNQTSKHTLEWNRRIGKIVGAEDEGLIRCLVCSRQWKWIYRSNMKKTRCSPQILPRACFKFVAYRYSTWDLHPSLECVPKLLLELQTNQIRQCIVPTRQSYHRLTSVHPMCKVMSCTRAFAFSRAIALTRPDLWDLADLLLWSSSPNMFASVLHALNHQTSWNKRIQNPNASRRQMSPSGKRYMCIILWHSQQR